MARTEYSAKITDSSRTLSAKEKIMLKDFSNANQLDDCEGVQINVDFFATIEVHNERSKGEHDYTKFVVVDKDGTRYITGSKSFISQLTDLADDVYEAQADGEDIELIVQVIKKDSKNYNGQFITCTLI